SPFSSPRRSSQPPLGNWSVIVSASSCPSTIVCPAFGPRPLKFAPHDAPASVMYGRFVYATFPTDEDVELCHAQYCEPKPEALLPWAVAITYCVEAFDEPVVLPKCCAARTASAASCDWLGCDGAADPLSFQVPARMLLGLPACWPLEPQNTVPTATPWQSCVTEFSQELPPTPWRKLCSLAASPDGSLPFHCEPQRTR